MSLNFRSKVLHSFKQLHKTRKKVFRDDTFALSEARKKINEEFKKQKHVSDSTAVQELLNYANAVEEELRTCVIQAREVEPGKYQAKITEETVKLDNVPFSECPNDKSLEKNK